MRGVCGAPAAGDALRAHTPAIGEPRRDPRIHARRGFSLDRSLQNGANSLAQQPAAAVMRQRSAPQRGHTQSQWRAASAATWDLPLEPEAVGVAVEAGEATAGTISFGGAVINTLNIMVHPLPSYLIASGTRCPAFPALNSMEHTFPLYTFGVVALQRRLYVRI